MSDDRVTITLPREDWETFLRPSGVEEARTAAVNALSCAELVDVAVPEPFYFVVTVDPQSPDCMFVDCETAEGKSIRVGKWATHRDGERRLGPFQEVSVATDEERICDACLTVTSEGTWNYLCKSCPTSPGCGSDGPEGQLCRLVPGHMGQHHNPGGGASSSSSWSTGWRTNRRVER